MTTKVFFLSLLMSATLLAAAGTKPPQQPLYGLVVVIDPGHGGSDPGAHGYFAGQMVVEDEYTYDLAKRLGRAVKALGGIPFLTIRDTKPASNTVRDWKAQTVFPDERSEVFSLDGSMARAGTAGLSKRLRLANQILRRYAEHRVVFISIHFDVVGNDADKHGVRIIAPDTSLTLVRALAAEFDKQHRLRDEFPLLNNGDKNHGLRRLYILGKNNTIPQRVLIELGNFKNESDVWRIRDFNVRQKFVDLIVNALKSLMPSSLVTQ